MLVIFQYINYQYLVLFSKKQLELDILDDSLNDSSTATVDSHTVIGNIINSIQTYVNWNFLALFFSVALIFQGFLKVLYNIFSNNKVGLDKWTFMDTISAVLNILAIQVIKRVSP